MAAAVRLVPRIQPIHGVNMKNVVMLVAVCGLAIVIDFPPAGGLATPATPGGASERP
jgi:hypothetical protein